ncbi:MAG: phage tail tip lysozyme [Bdellovibrionales bacterium]
MTVSKNDPTVLREVEPPPVVQKAAPSVLASLGRQGFLFSDGSSDFIRDTVAGIAAGLSEHLRPGQLSSTGNYSHIAPSRVDINANTKTAYDFFVSRGWSEAQSLGLVANLIHESGLNPQVRPGDGGLAVAIGQWHPPRQAICLAKLGYDLRTATLEQQLAFVDYELRNNEAKAGQLLAGATDPRDAAAIVSTYYERPLDRAGSAVARAGTAAGLAKKFLSPDPAVAKKPEPGAPASGPDSAVGRTADLAEAAPGPASAAKPNHKSMNAHGTNAQSAVVAARPFVPSPASAMS